VDGNCHCEPPKVAWQSTLLLKGKVMSNSKRGYVYILFNKRNGTLYTGVTSNLIKRVHEHKIKINDSFTNKYGIDKLGYYEIHNTIASAIEREKQIKSGTRKKKLGLIESINPKWNDLYDTVF
jgi:putative endonuclease